jgi:hypothetical protein
VAKDIGNVNVVDKNHPSIIEINKNKKDIPNLEFKEISDEFVHKQINKTNVKKATGRDGISAKLLKLVKAKQKYMCVYGHPTDPMNFYTEFG